MLSLQNYTIHPPYSSHTPREGREDNVSTTGCCSSCGASGAEAVLLRKCMGFLFCSFCFFGERKNTISTGELQFNRFLQKEPPLRNPNPNPPISTKKKQFNTQVKKTVSFKGASFTFEGPLDTFEKVDEREFYEVCSRQGRCCLLLVAKCER